MEARRGVPDLFVAALVLRFWCSTAAVLRCPDCGTTPLPYPLSTDPSCGDPLYKVRCVSGTIMFDTINSSYPVQSVRPQAQRLVITPANFTGDTCVTTDFPAQGVQLNASLPFNITSDNTIFYLNCSNDILNSPLNCSAASLCHTYVNATPDAAACAAAPLCCTFKTGGSVTAQSIRVRNSGCKAYRSFVNLNQALPVAQWGRPGIEVQWVLPQEPVCRSQSDCTDGSNATCSADPANPAINRCFCVPGLHWNAINGLCAENLRCQNNQGDCGGSSDRTPLIAGLTSGLGTAVLACAIAFFVYRRHRRIKEAQERIAREREEILNGGGGGKSAKIFTGKEIKKATNNFSGDRLLGVGGYGEVYKGILNDGTLVAIKCAKLGNAKGTDQVLNEVRILCQVNHRSLVGLLGCCVELEQPLLVYEYVSNGTLLEHLQHSKARGPGQLNWVHRLRIAHDTAEGLAYLHSSAVPPIYHRDIKSSNILLDQKLNAKVSDFGLSRLAHTDLSHISTCAQGTLGYLDPEYYRNYQLTDKSDVYSFGVVLLELLTAQKAIDFNREADDVNLAIYVQRMVNEERLMEAVDPMLKEGASGMVVDTVKALGFLAVSCLEERRQNRPSMKEITEEIEYIMSIATAKVEHEEY